MPDRTRLTVEQTASVMDRKKTGKERLQDSKERRRRLSRERAKRHYERQKQNTKVQRNEAKDETGGAHPGGFSSRQAFKRSLDRVREVLPRTPEKRAKIVKTLTESPETKAKLDQSHDTPLEGIKEMIGSVKQKRSDDARVAMTVGLSMLCSGATSQQQMAKELGINRRRIAASLQHRKNVLQNLQGSSWTKIGRKTRSDATPEADKTKAYDFWASPGISRPTGNKRDVARKRTGPNQYIEHEKQILEKTQTEVYREFKEKYPNIKMGQRFFEGCKPFFVIPTRIQDRNSCCCRIHIEIHMLFKSCMSFRRKLIAESPGTVNAETYDHLSDLVNSTICERSAGRKYNDKSCIYRECERCGTDKFKLLPEEKNATTTEKV